jgi:RNA polymerase sigma factor (TIGR02999 family)
MSDVTPVPDRIHHGDPKAAEELLPLVYGELRALAAQKFARLSPGQTLQATALVHDAWLKLTTGAPRQWENRRHFLATAAEAMRQILIDRARKKQAQRHGGGYARIDLDAIDVPLPAACPEKLLAIDQALSDLAKLDSTKAEVVRLKFFVGLSQREIADVLGVTERTVERYWAYAQAWLFERIGEGDA